MLLLEFTIFKSNFDSLLKKKISAAPVPALGFSYVSDLGCIYVDIMGGLLNFDDARLSCQVFGADLIDLPVRTDVAIDLYNFLQQSGL